LVLLRVTRRVVAPLKRIECPVGRPNWPVRLLAARPGRTPMLRAPRRA